MRNIRLHAPDVLYILLKTHLKHVVTGFIYFILKERILVIAMAYEELSLRTQAGLELTVIPPESATQGIKVHA